MWKLKSGKVKGLEDYKPLGLLTLFVRALVGCISQVRRTTQ